MKKKALLKLGLITTAAGVITTACLIGCKPTIANSQPMFSQTSVSDKVFDSETKEKFEEAIYDIIGEVNGYVEESESKISEVTQKIEQEKKEEQPSESVSEKDFSSMEQVTVVRVVDGDTYVVKLGDDETKVRLIGVDTPESVASEVYLEKTGKENTEFGKSVSDYMKNTIHEGDTLFLEFDVNKYDKYDRILAYAYFPDGEMIQEHLLKKGFAQVMTVQPNVAYSEHFVELEQKAMEEGVGMWEGYEDLFEEQDMER